MTDPPTLSIDPARQFGDVCIPGTRIPATAISGCVFAGDGVDFTADGYNITRPQVLLCCWWETRNAQQCAPSYRTAHQRLLVERWGDWANNYMHRIWNRTADQTPDPPSEEETA